MWEARRRTGQAGKGRAGQARVERCRAGKGTSGCDKRRPSDGTAGSEPTETLGAHAERYVPGEMCDAPKDGWPERGREGQRRRRGQGEEANVKERKEAGAAEKGERDAVGVRESCGEMRDGHALPREDSGVERAASPPLSTL